MDTEAVLDGLKCAGAVIVLGSALGTIVGSLTMAALRAANARRDRAALRQQAELAGERRPETPVRHGEMPDWLKGTADIDAWDTQPTMPAATWEPLPGPWGAQETLLLEWGGVIMTLAEFDRYGRVFTLAELKKLDAMRERLLNERAAAAAKAAFDRIFGFGEPTREREE